MATTEKLQFAIGKKKYYVFSEIDRKDKVVYVDDFGSHFYKNKGKIIYFTNQQEEEFRELRKKYN